MAGVIAYFGRFRHFRWNGENNDTSQVDNAICEEYFQTTSEQNNDIFRNSYTDDRQYLSIRKPERPKVFEQIHAAHSLIGKLGNNGKGCHIAN